MEIFPEGLHGAHNRATIMARFGRYGLRTALDDGRLVSFSRTVVVETRRATEFWTRAAAWQLTAGEDAVLSGPSALLAHGCSAADAAPIHLVVPYARTLRNRPGLLVHHGSCSSQDVLDVGGLRVLCLEVALADSLARLRPRQALACADQALRLMPPSERPEFRACLENRVRARSDPRGRRQAVYLLDLATGLAESPAESWMLLAMVDGGLPVPEQQYSVTDLAGNEVYRLDFAWPEARVAVEYDGYEAHESRREADAARDADLRRRGWMVIRAGAEDLSDASRVVNAVESAFRRRGLAA